MVQANVNNMAKKQTKPALTPQQQETVNRVKIQDYREIVHMAFTKHHLSKSIGTFNCPGLPLHEKEFICESKTPRKSDFSFGKQKSTYYLNGNDTPMFNTMAELVLNYHPLIKCNATTDPHDCDMRNCAACQFYY